MVTAGFVLNGGGTVYVMALPAGVDLTITNDTTLGMNGGNVALGTLTVTDGGCLSAGQVTATTCTLNNGFLDCGLSGGPITVSGISTLYGSNGAGDDITISIGSTLYVGDGGLVDSSVSNGGVLAFNPLSDQTFSGAITGTGVIQVMGPATEVFTGTIASGCAGVQIDGGMAEFATLAALPGSGQITINGGGALEAAGAYTTVTAWLGSGLIDPSSTGAMALAADSGNNQLRGFGPLSLGAAANVNYAGTLTPFNETYQLGGGPGTLTVGAALADNNGTPCGVAVNGNVVFAVANTYSDGTFINAGTLGIAADSALGDGSITFGTAGALQALGSFACSQNIVTPNDSGQVATIDPNGNSLELAGPVSGADGLCLTDSAGGGVLRFSGINIFQGNVEIAGGMADFQTANSLPGGVSILIDSGGALEADPNGPYATPNAWLQSTVIDISSSGTLALTADGNQDIDMSGYPSLSLGAVTNLTYNHTITPYGNTYMIGGGPGTLTLASALIGAYNVTINGNVSLAADIDCTGDLTVNSLLDLYGNNVAVAGLWGAGTVQSSTAAAALTVDGNGETSIFNGTLQDGGTYGQLAICVANGCTVVLAGTSTFSGDTAIDSTSTLDAGVEDALSPNSPLLVSGTLDLCGFSSTSGPLTGNGTIQSSVGPAAFTVAGGGTAFYGTLTDCVGPLSVIVTGSGTAILGGTNLSTGGLDIEGAAQLASASAFGAGGLTVNGTLNLAGYSNSVAVAGLWGSGTVETTTADATLTVRADGGWSSFTGKFQDDGGKLGLDVTGASTLTLGGDDTQSGDTRVELGSELIVGTNGELTNTRSCT